MGYTHYWTVKRNTTPESWLSLATDARALADAFGPISAVDGPKFSADAIRFNGKEPDDYETFILTPAASHFEFCKTQFRPYDALVCAVLIAAKHHLGDDISIRSDGEWHEWSAGQELYRQVFADRPLVSVLDSDDED